MCGSTNLAWRRRKKLPRVRNSTTPYVVHLVQLTRPLPCPGHVSYIMNSIRNIQKLNERELEAAVPSSGSWHTDYRDTAYIYIGGLGLDLSEGDVITIFSQYGDPVWIKLARDKETGKSRGFAWLKYEDQRSCDLAVDNLSGASVMGRLLAVDHTRYKKRDDEIEADGYVGQDNLGAGQEEESASEDEARPMIREEIELQKLLQDHDEDDPMKAYMVQSKKEEISKALEARSHDGSRRKDKERRRHRKHRSRSPNDRRRRSRSRDHERRRRDRSEPDERREHRRHRSTERLADGHAGSRHDRHRDDHDRHKRRSRERHERRRDDHRDG